MESTLIAQFVAVEQHAGFQSIHQSCLLHHWDNECEPMSSTVDQLSLGRLLLENALVL
jgi:hypothetical protein